MTFSFLFHSIFYGFSRISRRENYLIIIIIFIVILKLNYYFYKKEQKYENHQF